MIKATRLYRTLPVLMVMLVSVAFANLFSINIIYLGLTCVFIYAAAGLHNAVKDKDYSLPNYSKIVIFGLLIIAIIISLQNVIVFFTGILWVVLGLFYNTIARRILFGDATVLAVSHFALPSVSASLLLGIDISFALTLAGFMFITFWFIMHSKNLKDTKDDEKRGYKTLSTKFRNGKLMSVILLIAGFLFMFSAYPFFNLTNKFLLIFLIVFVIQVITVNRIINNRNQAAVKLIRLIMILFLLGIIIDRTSDIKVIVISLSLFLTYFILLLKNLIAKERYIKTKIDVAGG